MIKVVVVLDVESRIERERPADTAASRASGSLRHKAPNISSTSSWQGCADG